MYSLKKKDPSHNRYSIKHENQHGPATYQLKTQREPGPQPRHRPAAWQNQQHPCTRGPSRPLASSWEVPAPAKPPCACIERVPSEGRWPRNAHVR